MGQLIRGLHHITALTSNAQKNLDFYAGILGLRLVKKTINFDAPDVYHLYYGNENGTPGTILTFFPISNLPKGKKGVGQLTTISFSINENVIDYWIKRLSHFHIKYELTQKRFDDEAVIYFEDHEGLGLELVANKKDRRIGFSNGLIPSDFAIKGFYGITLSEECHVKTAELLVKHLDYTLISENNNRFRYSLSGTETGFVDIVNLPEMLPGMGGSGTVHHVAFATETDQSQIEARASLIKNGFNVTPVIDREYFHSIYFREPGGVLFEIATIPPGFTIDEPLNHLGESLKLPPWEEKNRISIEKKLQPIKLDLDRFKNG